VVPIQLIKALRDQIRTNNTLHRVNFIIYSEKQRTTTMIGLHLKKNF